MDPGARPRRGDSTGCFGKAVGRPGWGRGLGGRGNATSRATRVAVRHRLAHSRFKSETWVPASRSSSGPISAMGLSAGLHLGRRSRWDKGKVQPRDISTGGTTQRFRMPRSALTSRPGKSSSAGAKPGGVGEVGTPPICSGGCQKLLSRHARGRRANGFVPVPQRKQNAPLAPRVAQSARVAAGSALDRRRLWADRPRAEFSIPRLRPLGRGGWYAPGPTPRRSVEFQGKLEDLKAGPVASFGLARKGASVTNGISGLAPFRVAPFVGGPSWT